MISRIGPSTTAQCLRTSSTMTSPSSAMRYFWTLGSKSTPASGGERGEELADGRAGVPDGADRALDGVGRVLRARHHVEDREDDDRCDEYALDPLHASSPSGLRGGLVRPQVHASTRPFLPHERAAGNAPRRR